MGNCRRLHGHRAPQATRKFSRASIVRSQRREDAGHDGRSDDPDPDELGRAVVAFVGNNQALLDHWLLERFPGRTLEELDGVDWLRLERAQEVGRIINAERKRQQWLDQKLTAESITDDEWREIERNDRLVGDGD